MLLAGYHDIIRDQEPPENPSQMHHLPKAVGDLPLDYQEVKVASLVPIVASTRSEQDHLVGV
jgi:hypothetical protein